MESVVWSVLEAVLAACCDVVNGLHNEPLSPGFSICEASIINRQFVMFAFSIYHMRIANCLSFLRACLSAVIDMDQYLNEWIYPVGPYLAPMFF